MMAETNIDSDATQKLQSSPISFLQKNFIKISRDQLELGSSYARLTWLTASGNPATDKYPDHSGKYDPIHWRQPSQEITADDCLRITSIGGRNRPTLFIGLKKPSLIGLGKEYSPQPNFYLANMSINLLPQYIKVFYLPASTNQITSIILPAHGGPDIVLTAPLTGCTLYTGFIQGEQALCHANAFALKKNRTLQYMTALKNQYKNQTNNNGEIFDKHDSLKKTEYRREKARFKESIKQEKLDLKRTNIEVNAEKMTTVFGIRDHGHWSFYYQNYVQVVSTRRGLKALIRGEESNKGKINLIPI